MKNILILLFVFCTGWTFSQEEKTAPQPPSTSNDFNDQDTIPRSRMDADGIYFDVDTPAEFNGGKSGLIRFLSGNLNYPSTALKKKLQGKCYLRFIVNAEGTISSVTVVKGVTDCPECDAEAVRVVKMMPKWIPATVDGKKVDSYFNLPMTFKLN